MRACSHFCRSMSARARPCWTQARDTARMHLARQLMTQMRRGVAQSLDGRIQVGVEIKMTDTNGRIREVRRHVDFGDRQQTQTRISNAALEGLRQRALQFFAKPFGASGSGLHASADSSSVRATAIRSKHSIRSPSRTSL